MGDDKSKVDYGKCHFKSTYDWFELDRNMELILKRNFLESLYKKMRRNYTYKSFDKKIGVAGFCNRLRTKISRIRIGVLKRVLSELDFDLTEASKEILLVGRFGSLKLRFPYLVSPFWGEILSHAFFDGYADTSIMRYSNYDLDVRKEFVYISKKLGVTRINAPKNYKQDIDLPDTVPKMLNSIFKVRIFHSKKCRIPKRFFEVVKNDCLFGWYFLKGAFLDEGTVNSGQIWVVRGITNRELAQDLVKLCRLLGLRVRIQETHKNYSYSVGINHQSFELFCSNILKLTKYHGKKMQKLKIKYRAHRKKKERIMKVRRDCDKIIKYLRMNKAIKTSKIKELCGISDLAALMRAKILLQTKNIKNVEKGKKSYYVLKSDKIPEKIPRINDIRRLYAWR